MTDSSDEGGGVRFSRVEDDDVDDALGEVIPDPGASGGSGPFLVRPTDRKDRPEEFVLTDFSPLDLDTMLFSICFGQGDTDMCRVGSTFALCPTAFCAERARELIAQR